MIAVIIAWVGTLFRGAGMLANGEDMVKFLVSVGNLFWMINGIMTSNTPLMVSNGFCIAVIAIDIIKKVNLRN